MSTGFESARSRWISSKMFRAVGAVVLGSALAVVATLLAPSAQAAASHWNTDPYLTGCAKSSWTLSTRSVPGGTASIKVSNACSTNWLEYSGKKQSTTKTIKDHVTNKWTRNEVDNLPWSYSMQVYGPGTRPITATIKIGSTTTTANCSVSCTWTSVTTTSPTPVSTLYNRSAAASWAKQNWNADSKFSTDCTWFVSQALWAGGLPKTSSWTNRSLDWNDQAAKSMYPGPSRAAANADYFKNALRDAGYATVKEVNWSDNTAGGARIGDVIAYDWDGAADGIIDHVAIVTSLNASGQPSVTQHTPNQASRYWSWSESEGKWIQSWNPRARVYLIKIVK